MSTSKANIEHSSLQANTWAIVGVLFVCIELCGEHFVVADVPPSTSWSRAKLDIVKASKIANIQLF